MLELRRELEQALSKCRIPDEELPAVISTEFLSRLSVDPDDEDSFNLSFAASMWLTVALCKIDRPVAVFYHCVNTLIGIEATAAGLSRSEEGKWRFGNDVRGEYRRVGFATGITGRILVDDMIGEYVAADRSLAFDPEGIIQSLAPYLPHVGKDDAWVRNTFDRYLVQNANIWRELRQFGCAVVKLMADNIAALSGADVDAHVCLGLGMRHPS